MKKILLSIVICFISLNFAKGQDSIRVYRSGIVIFSSAISQVDSITFVKRNLPLPSFTASNSSIAVGDTISFQNTTKFGLKDSLNASFSWIFSGASPAYSTENNPSNIVYKKSGNFDVKLIIKVGDETDSIVYKSFINVLLPVRDSSLVIYYPFSGDLKNAVSSKNNGEAISMYPTSDRDGNPNSAMQFGDFLKLVSCGENPIQPNKSFTMSALIYPKSILHTVYNVNDNQYIISTGSQSNSSGYFLLWNNGKLRFGMKTATMSCDTTYTSALPAKWHHVACSYDSLTNTVKLYLNGKKVLETPLVNKGQKWANNFSTLVIGAPNTPYDYDFFGIIDEVRIYNRALSEDELKYFK